MSRISHSRWNPVRIAASCGGMACLSLALSGCASTGMTARSNSPDDQSVQAVYRETTDAAGRPVDRRSSPIQQIGHEQPAYSERPTQQYGIALASGMRLESTPHEARCPAPMMGPPCPPGPYGVPGQPCPSPFSAGPVDCNAENAPSPVAYPDEYLFDGGDRELPVHYAQDERRLGLDSEDSVIEFTDHTGRNRMKPSNRVAIFAPRFATVRTVSRPHEDSMLSEIAGMGGMVGTNAMHTRLKASHHVKREMTGRVAVRSRASGLESEQLQGNVSDVRSLIVHEKLLNVYQDLSFVQMGKYVHTDAARLNYGLNAALTWTREDSPIIAAKIDTAVEGLYEAHAATIVGIDDTPSNKPADLRIVKLADKHTAVPGDVIEFTLRYDNLGAREARDVRIVDNLTPRLEYIDQSATSDRDGELRVESNGEGSQILTWVLKDPLLTKQGGVVSFKARVR